MNLLEILESIWSLKARAALLAVLAVCLAVLLTFRVSLSPVGLHPRALQLGVGQTQLLVDSGHSPLADAEAPFGDLSSLAADYSELINSPSVIGPVARSIGVRPAEIGVEEQLLQNVPLAQSDAREAQVGAQLLAAQHHYSVLVRNDNGTFVIQIYTQAPTGRQAVRLANAVAHSLSSYAASVAGVERIPLGRRVILRQLGAATGGVVDHSASLDAAILGALAIWIFGVIAMLTLRRLRSRRTGSSPRTATASPTASR